MDDLPLEEHIEAAQAHSTQFPIIMTYGFFVNTKEFCKILRAQRSA
jgi:hypothetical protein